MAIKPVWEPLRALSVLTWDSLMMGIVTLTWLRRIIGNAMSSIILFYD
tara:strand:+ start:1146 stop:1289 length:144 start_codon:yes stop_codon:yes gene_type:complete